MEGLPTSILPREARFAYVGSAFWLAEIYVPFVDHTDARNAPAAITKDEAPPAR